MIRAYICYITILFISLSSCAQSEERDFSSTHTTLPYNPDEIFFEVEVPVDFNGPVELKDGSLFGISRHLIATYSTDGGRTWKDSGVIVGETGREINGGEGSFTLRPFSLIRLRSGAIALIYLKCIKADSDNNPVKFPGPGNPVCYFIKSLDEGKTWSVPVRINQSAMPFWAQWMIQTKTGRLVLEAEYFFHQPEQRKMAVSTCYYSDDEGSTWNVSTENLYVWENDGALIGMVEEPSIAETNDGRLLMFMRTELGRIAQSYSPDDGTHWQPVTLNELVSSRAELWLAKIPTTGDLLCVWNQATDEEIKTGFYRARLTSAISKDSGETWEHFRTVAASPGMKKITRLADPDPPRFLRAGGAVPPKELVSPEGFWMNRNPRISFVGEKVFMVYEHRVYRYPDGSETWERVYNKRRLRVFPVEWFYGDDEM